ncbi:hypothetical protein B0F88_1216 [Methylobacter tundripaludum]|uniref:Uncharacterized protein n=1 Tax=Methylobacter tundripaludum TaxID=173365 RepID=A0A2S6GJA3_9GAMM|nr:hypothetical protein B0F88_1216 [Methylobacter tundripaludum]
MLAAFMPYAFRFKPIRFSIGTVSYALIFLCQMPPPIV